MLKTHLQNRANLTKCSNGWCVNPAWTLSHPKTNLNTEQFTKRAERSMWSKLISLLYAVDLKVRKVPFHETVSWIAKCENPKMCVPQAPNQACYSFSKGLFWTAQNSWSIFSLRSSFTWFPNYFCFTWHGAWLISRSPLRMEKSSPYRKRITKYRLSSLKWIEISISSSILEMHCFHPNAHNRCLSIFQKESPHPVCIGVFVSGSENDFDQLQPETNSIVDSRTRWAFVFW